MTTKTTKKKPPMTSADLAAALAQTRAELGRLAREMLTDDSGATRELYDAEKRTEGRLVAMLEEARAAEERARQEAEEERLRPLREELESLEAVVSPGWLDTRLRERYFPALGRLFDELHALESGIAADCEEQKRAARMCGELAAQMGVSWGVAKPFPTMQEIRGLGRAYLERELRDNPDYHGQIPFWFPHSPAARKD